METMEMENENIDVIEQLKTAIADIIEYQKHLAEEITSIKTDLMDNLINPIKGEFEKYQHDEALSDFRCKYAEKLDGFNDKLKVLEHNPDFDIVEKAFDAYTERTDGMGEDEYVEKLANHIQEQLDEIGKAYGVEPEKIEEVKVETTDGEEIKAEVEDGQVVEVEKEVEKETEEKEVEKEETATDETEKEVEEESTADVETEGETEELSEEEENARHMAELEEEKKREGIE